MRTAARNGRLLMINDVLIQMDGYSEIVINTRHGQERVKVDKEDLIAAEELSRLVLYKDPKGRKMARATKEDDQVLLHRHLFEIPKGSRLEWRNRDTLDLRRENLILLHKNGEVEFLKRAEPSYEELERKHMGDPVKRTGIYAESKHKKSDVRGVYFHKASERWNAAAFFEKKRYSLGYFQDEADAIAEVTIFRSEGPNSPKLKRNQRKGK
jgi:hypothetical protein